MSKRFRADRAEIIVLHLHASGEDPSASTAPPSRGWHNACLDAACCGYGPHPGITRAGEPMLSVNTTASGSRLHKLAVELGLVPE